MLKAFTAKLEGADTKGAHVSVVNMIDWTS
jgi:hypothetical protein